MRRAVKYLLILFILPLFLGKSVSVEAKSPDRSVCTDSGWESLKIVNKCRIDRGLEPLAVSEKMYSGSKKRVKELRRSFSHTRPNGESYKTLYVNKKYITGLKESIFRNVRSERRSVCSTSEDGCNLLSENAIHFSTSYNAGYCVNLYSGCNCKHSLKIKDKGNIINVPVGMSITNLGLVLQTSCKHGKGYIPLVSQMVKGYNKNKLGFQTVIVAWNNEELMLNFKVTENNLKYAKLVNCPDWACYYGGPCVLEGYKVKYFNRVLKEGRDYTVSYKNNKKEGKAKMILQGIGKYKGKLVHEFDCTKFTIIWDIKA